MAAQLQLRLPITEQHTHRRAAIALAADCIALGRARIGMKTQPPVGAFESPLHHHPRIGSGGHDNRRMQRKSAACCAFVQAACDTVSNVIKGFDGSIPSETDVKVIALEHEQKPNSPVQLPLIAPCYNL